MLLGNASQSLLQLGSLLLVVSWLGQELLDLLAGESPARLGLEAQGQRVRVCAGMTASERLQLPAGRGLRHALVLAPTGPCPRQYPRAVGLPAKQPLGGGGPTRPSAA